jgi:riboflavin kinase/FMN adenylyltransferase
VHQGHQFILTELKQAARHHRCLAGLVTFEPSPQLIIHREFPFILTPLDEKAEYLAGFGLDFLYLVAFDENLRGTTAQFFLEEIVLRPLKPSVIVVGYDFRFGSGRQGDASLLTALQAAYGFELKVLPEFRHDGDAVKSTRVRERLVLGAVRQAAELLGRRYRIKGRVVRGFGVGHDLGFPTVNLQLLAPEKLIPAPGVYAVQLQWNGSRFSGVMNIGFRPTFVSSGDTIPNHTTDSGHVPSKMTPPTIEIHILDFQGQLYDRVLTVEFVERLRPEAKFGSTDGLKRQIAADIALARLILAESSGGQGAQ